MLVLQGVKKPQSLFNCFYMVIKNATPDTNLWALGEPTPMELLKKVYLGIR